MYGQGFWGNKVTSEELGVKSDEDVSLTIFKNALSGSKMAVHSRSGNVYATLDNDDFFQYLGGTAMAIRAVDGKSPEFMSQICPIQKCRNRRPLKSSWAGK